jgi:lactoylglutathione lyase
LHAKIVDAGFPSMMDPVEPERWPVTVSFVADPDGYQVELVERHRDRS